LFVGEAQEKAQEHLMQRIRLYHRRLQLLPWTTRLVAQLMGQTQSRSVQVQPQSLSDPTRVQPRSLRALLVLAGLQAPLSLSVQTRSLQASLSLHAAPAGLLPESQRYRTQNLTPANPPESECVSLPPPYLLGKSHQDPLCLHLVHHPDKKFFQKHLVTYC
jgi:hypothetical protein